MSNTESIKVWDPLVRLFHWGVVVAFTLAWLVGDDWLALHIIAGYSVLTLLLVRLLWGLVGTPHARFSDFVCPPREVFAYLRDIAANHPRRYLGHNPAGGAMVIALLATLMITTLSGLALYAASEFSGPLAPWLGHIDHQTCDIIEAIHEGSVNVVWLLVLLHLIGVALASLQHSENLPRAMLTGNKKLYTGDKA